MSETRIDSLQIQIESNASDATKKINALARSLKKLGENSDLTKVVDNLSRLNGVLEKLNGTKSNLSGLSSQLTQTSGGMRNVSSSSKEMGKSLNTGSLNIMSMIENFQSLMFVLNSVVDVFSEVIGQAMSWDGIQYRFGRAFGEDAEEMYQYILKVNEVLGLNVQEFMQYSSVYGSLLKGFGVTQDKVTVMSKGLSELTYDLWSANNDNPSYKRYEDVAQAVRSAITGELEPVRNLGIAMSEATLQEYIESVGMAGVSVEKLTEAQKAELRYAALVNGAMNQGIVGNYAREMNTAEGAVRGLSQSFKGLVQALGSLFIPMLQKVIPYVTAFVEILTELVFWVASISGIEIQPITWDTTGANDLSDGVKDVATGADDATKGLKDAAKAAKKLKDYTMGFDELNVISPPTDTSSGSGGSSGSSGTSGWGDGLDLNSLWNEKVFEQASQKVNELKEKVMDFVEKWKEGLALLGTSLGLLAASKFWSVIGDALGWGEKFLGVMKTLSKIASTGIVIAVQFMLVKDAFSDAIAEGSLGEYIKGLIIAGIGTGILYSMLGPSGIVIGLGVTAVASISAIIDNGGIKNVEGVAVALTGFASALGSVALGVKLLKDTDVGAFFALLKEGEPFVGTLAAAFPKLANAFTTIGGYITSAATAVGSFVAGISAPVWATIAAVVTAIGSAAYFLYENWEQVTKAVKDFFNENIVPKLEEIKGHFEKMKTALGPVADALIEAKDNLVKAKDSIVEFLSAIKTPVLEGLGKAIETLGGIVFAAFSGTIVGAFQVVISVIENFVQIVSGIIDTVSGVVKALVAIWTGDFSEIEKITEQISQGIVDIFGGLWGLIDDPIGAFVEGVINWFFELWDELVGHSIVPDTVDAIVEWFLSLPGKILAPVKTFTENVVSTFKTMWNNIKTWYSSNVAPKFTLAYWKNVFDTVRAGLKDKLDSAWSAVKSFFAVDSWKSRASNAVVPLKTQFGEIYTSLKGKLDDAWKKVTNFFSTSEWKTKVKNAVNAIKNNFKMPTLPKIKLEITYSTNVSALKKSVYKALGLSGWPSLKWKAYAQGGLPSTGEMYIAREAGPELVGRIGNSNAVVNNDQIVTAVSQGVYSAVRAAMGEGSDGTQNVNVYLDGKQIYASVKKTESSRGVSLMGNQLGYLY